MEIGIKSRLLLFVENSDAHAAVCESPERRSSDFLQGVRGGGRRNEPSPFWVNRKMHDLILSMESRTRIFFVSVLCILQGQQRWQLQLIENDQTYFISLQAG